MPYSLKIFYRNLLKKPIYSIISIGGFVIGICAALLISLWIVDEFGHDKFHPNYKQVYRVLTLSKQGEGVIKSASNYRTVAKTLRADYPQISKATFLTYGSENEPLQKMSGGDKIDEKGVWTNADFFDVFQGFEFVEGDKDEVFSSPENVVLSEKVAKKLFGESSALGQVLVSNKYHDIIYKVSAVVRIPENSHFDFGFLYGDKHGSIVNRNNDWIDKAYVRVYIALDENAAITNTFLNDVSNHIGKYTNKTDKLFFQPLSDIHLFNDYESYQFDKNLSSIKYVWIFSALALLILLMAIFNFGALSVARFSDRLTEIGIKKANGAKCFSIARQFLIEAIVQTTFASFIALFLVQLLIPWFNQISHQNLSLTFNISMLLGLLAMLFVIGLVAGLYPALFLSFVNPVQLLKKVLLTPKHGFYKYVSGALFFICMVLMVLSVVLVKQIEHIHQKDTGLVKDDVVVFPTGLWYDNQAFKDDLLKHPNILNVSASGHAPVDIGWKSNFKYKRNGVLDSLELSWFFADENFAATYGLELLEGSFFESDYSSFFKTMDKQGDGLKNEMNIPVVVNQTAANALGFDNPIGECFGNHFVVGVVKDFNFRPLHHAVSPLVIQYDPQNIMTMSVKIRPSNSTATIQYIREVYQKHNDKRAFSFQFFDDMIADKYLYEINLKNIMLMFALLSVVMAMLGVFGMTWYAVEQRTKEIGIRKVNGAQTVQVVFWLNVHFLQWVILSVIFAIPVSAYFASGWLSQFAYKTSLSWWVFALAGCAALLIAIITTSWQTYRAASRNPVEALRYE